MCERRQLNKGRVCAELCPQRLRNRHSRKHVADILVHVHSICLGYKLRRQEGREVEDVNTWYVSQPSLFIQNDSLSQRLSRHLEAAPLLHSVTAAREKGQRSDRFITFLLSTHVSRGSHLITTSWTLFPKIIPNTS